jgi:hypothetical protein
MQPFKLVESFRMIDPDYGRIAAAYRRFSDQEARGRSPLYETLAREVADDPALLELLAGLPPPKRQPNLLFAAVRRIAGVPEGWPAFRRAVSANWSDIRAIILAHSTQTNEPGRCATLLPLFARFPEPLALIEVGASAGLCLLPDRYAYTYGQHAVRADDARADAPIFPCQASANTPLPRMIPRIIWRAGLDINPLDVTDAQQMAWLETLVWPEQADRAERLRAAVRIARDDPPRVVRGDLRDSVAMLAKEAPKDATLVVFHTAVLAYVSAETERSAFAASVSALCDYWVSNEAPRAVPGVAEQAPTQRAIGRFILAVNGVPVAWTDPHGTAIEWFGEVPKPNPRTQPPAALTAAI